MFRKALMTVVMGAAWMGAAHAKNPMIHESEVQAVSPPTPGKAQIVFLRPSSYFPFMTTMLYEVRDGQDMLIAPIGGKHKVVYEVEPGQKLFLSNNGIGAHFMNATVESGKRYYVLVRPIHGNGFQLRPMRKDGTTDYNTRIPEFEGWLAETVRVEATDEAKAPFAPRVQKGNTKVREKGQTNWSEKTPEQVAELTLNLDDGFE